MKVVVCTSDKYRHLMSQWMINWYVCMGTNFDIDLLCYKKVRGLPKWINVVSMGTHKGIVEYNNAMLKGVPCGI